MASRDLSQGLGQGPGRHLPARMAAEFPQRGTASSARNVLGNRAEACGLQTRRFGMKIVVIGGTGLIGSKTVAILRQRGHEVVAASPDTGVNTITGEGLKEAMAGTQVVIDLANSPSFEDKAVLEFFQTSGRNLLAAEAAAGVLHHVARSMCRT